MAEAARRQESPAWRRLGLTLHILLSVGLMGAIASFFALILVGIAAPGPQASGAFWAAERLSTLLIVPIALLGWAAAVVQALLTPWGLAKHYWVLTKLLITTFAIVVLLAKQPLIHALATESGVGSTGYPGARFAALQLLVHAGAGFAVLLIPLLLSVMKPAGRTGIPV